MNALAQIRRQTSFDLLVFRRNPAAAFFTVVFPLIFFLLFNSIFGNEELESGVKASTLIIPGILTLQVVSATFANMAMTTTIRRQRGFLKRVRGTPLPAWVFVTAQATASMLIMAASSVLLIVLGRLFYGVTVQSAGIVPLILTLIISATSFSALGLAITAAIPSENAAPAMTNVIVLPLYFISDVFIVGDKPKALETIANLFPVQHTAAGLAESFNPLNTGSVWPWDHWLVIAAWGLFGLAMSIKFFRWTPR